MRTRARLEGASLFAIERGAHVLCVPSGATGHVVRDRGRFAIGPHAMRIPLDESARGQIVVASATVLFQFVVPPPRPSRPQLPLATKRGEIDWMLTILVGVSFLLHFGFIGTMFSDWADPVVSEDGAVVGLVDMTSKLPTAVVEERAEDPSANTNASTSMSTKSATSSTHTSARANASNAGGLAREAEAMRIGLLAAFGETSAVEGALRRGEIPLPDLTQAGESAQGVTSTAGELRLATNDGTTAPGSRTLTTLGDTRGNDARAGHTRDVIGPKFEMSTSEPEFAQGSIGVESAIARLRPSFRSCYVRKGLDVDPSMEGKLTIEFRVAPNGDVADVVKVDGAGLSSAVEQCIIDRARSAVFGATSGSGTRVRVPVIFSSSSTEHGNIVKPAIEACKLQTSP